MTSSMDIPSKISDGAKVKFNNYSSPRIGSGRFVSDSPPSSIPSLTTIHAAQFGHGSLLGGEGKLVDQDEVEEEHDDDRRSRTFNSVQQMWSPCPNSLPSSAVGYRFLTPPQSSYKVNQRSGCPTENRVWHYPLSKFIIVIQYIGLPCF